jgi:hypothetical protein
VYSIAATIANPPKKPNADPMRPIPVMLSDIHGQHSRNAGPSPCELPEGRVVKPTSGYLYFRLPEGKNRRGYELMYYGEKRVILPMAVEKK